MCQHEERGPHAQLISAISPNALCASFVGSAFVTQRESEAGREEEGCRKRAQEQKCYSNSNCPCSLFAFVWGWSAMIRWSLLHFTARPPLSPHTHAPAHCQVCPVSALTDFAVDAYRKLALFLSLSFSPSLSSIFFLPLSLCLDHLSLLGRSIRCTDSALVIGPLLSIISCSSKDTLQLNTIWDFIFGLSAWLSLSADTVSNKKQLLRNWNK